MEIDEEHDPVGLIQLADQVKIPVGLDACTAHPDLSQGNIIVITVEAQFPVLCPRCMPGYSQLPGPEKRNGKEKK